MKMYFNTDYIVFQIMSLYHVVLGAQINTIL